jgi:fibronectin-binding autotransporter adhesin
MRRIVVRWACMRGPAVLAISVLMLALPATASAQTTDWTGTNSANWSDAGNWTAGVPTAGSTVQFSNSSTANLSTNNDISGLSLLGITNTLSPSGNVSISGNALTLGSGGINYTGSPSAATKNLSVNTDLALSASQDWKLGGVGLTLTIGTSSANTVALNGNTLTLRHVGNVEFMIINSSIVNGTGAGALSFLASSGTSKTQYRLLGTNTYSGGTTSTGANQIIQLGASSAIGSGPLGTGNITFSSASTFLEAYGSDRTLDNNITINSGATLIATTTIGEMKHNLTLNGTISSLTGNRTILVDAANTSAGSGDLVFNGNILLGTSGQAGGTLTTGETGGTAAAQGGKIVYNGNLLETSGVTSGVIVSVVNGSGTFQTKVQLNGQNTYSGGTSIGAGQGIIEIGSSSTVVAGNIVSGPLGKGALTFNNAGNTPRIEAVGAQTVANNITMTSSGIVQGPDDLTLTGIISSTGNLIKNGTGKLTLTGTNIYSGNTTVNAGTLLVNNTTGSGTGSGLVTVNGGTLGGTGTIGGAVTVNAGTFAPGASVGTLTLNSGMVLNSASQLAYELSANNTTAGGTANDLVAITGNLTLDGTLNVTEVSGAGTFLANAQAGNSWRLMTYTGTLADNTLVTGTMPTLGAGLAYAIDVDTVLKQVNLLVVAAVPEAGSFAAMGLVGLLSLGGVWIRRWMGRGTASV